MSRKCSLLTLVVMVFAAAKSVLAWDLDKPIPAHKPIVRLVARLMEREHLSGRRLDDEVSKRALKNFLDQLDPMKLYFQSSDLNEFSESKDKIDDMIRAGDVSFAYKVFKKFLKRIDERLATVESLVDATHDFTKDEFVILDPKKRKHPLDEKEATDKWRRYIKYELLLLRSNKSVKAKQRKEKLKTRYREYSKRMHRFKDNDLLEVYLSSVTNSFDPHSSYFSPRSTEDFKLRMRLHYQGIGAELGREGKDAVIKKVLPHGAAAKQSKMQTGDRVVAVGQNEKGEMVDVTDKSISDIIQLIRGKVGTLVRIRVLPAGSTKPRLYKIKRAKIELKEDATKGEVFPHKLADNRELKIGFIDVPSFYADTAAQARGAKVFRSTTQDVRKILKDFKKKKVGLVVVDLRRNSGGYLTEAMQLTGLFIDQGTILQVKGSDGRVQPYKIPIKGPDWEGQEWDGPLVVLTSRFSASASEIFAGAVQDYHRGLLVGDKGTHGKGTVQSFIPLNSLIRGNAKQPKLGSLKLTLHQFYRPNGDSTQRRGIVPDIVFPSMATQLSGGEAELEYAMKFDRVPTATFAKLKLTSAELVGRLRELSRERQGKSKNFKTLQKQISHFSLKKKRKKFPVSEAKFLEQQKSDEITQKAIGKFRRFHQRPDFKKLGFFLEEVFTIAADYVAELKKTKKAAAKAGG